MDDHIVHRSSSTANTPGDPIPKWQLFALVCFGYALSHAVGEMPVLLATYNFGAVEAGKLIGVLAVLILAYRSRPEQFAARSPYPALITGGVIAALGTAMLVAENCLGCPPLAVDATCLLIGVGAATGSVLWLGMCCALDPKTAILALIVTNMLDSLVILALHGMPTTAVLYALQCVIGLAPLVVALSSRRGKPLASVVRTYSQRIPEGGLLKLIPLDVVIWAVVNSAALSFVESAGMGSATGTIAASVGQIAPCAVLLLAYVALGDRFDMRILLATSLPPVISSLIVLGLNDLNSVLAAGVYMMGGVIARVVYYSIALIRAYQFGVSGLLGAGVVMATNISAHNIWRSLFDAGPGLLHSNVALITVVFIDTFVIVCLIMREVDWLHTVDSLPGHEGADPGVKPVALSKEAGLTEREEAIYVRLLEGKGVKEIASELFISGSTVRSHMSHIYDKLGVHSMAEFCELTGLKREE